MRAGKHYKQIITDCAKQVKQIMGRPPAFFRRRIAEIKIGEDPDGAGGYRDPKNMDTVRSRGYGSPRWGGREKPHGKPDSEGAVPDGRAKAISEPGAR